jgi:ribosomal protein S18 acetylase RimI-like enzyme
MSRLTIEDARSEHIALLSTMWQQIDQAASQRPFGGDTDAKQARATEFIEHAIKSPNAILLVACKNNAQHKKIVGTITGHLYERPAVKLSSVGVIYSLWVNAEDRRQGVGQLLLTSIEQRLVTLGAQALQVGWDTDNKQAGAWWQKRGFKGYEMIASKNLDLKQY